MGQQEIIKGPLGFVVRWSYSNKIRLENGNHPGNLNVSEVTPGSLAATKNLQKGDIIKFIVPDEDTERSRWARPSGLTMEELNQKPHPKLQTDFANEILKLKAKGEGFKIFIEKSRSMTQAHHQPSPRAGMQAPQAAQAPTQAYWFSTPRYVTHYVRDGSFAAPQWETGRLYIDSQYSICYEYGNIRYQNITAVENRRTEKMAILTFTYEGRTTRDTIIFRSGDERNKFSKRDFLEAQYQVYIRTNLCPKCKNKGGSWRGCNICKKRSRRRMAVREFSSRRDSPVLVRLLEEIVAANERNNG